jgi:hypothetical protein
MSERNVQEWQSDLDLHCSKFLFDGHDFYLHGKGCLCFNCSLSRRTFKATPQEIADFHCVTLNLWDKDKHWYQALGCFDKEWGARLCIEMAKKDGVLQ